MNCPGKTRIRGHTYPSPHLPPPAQAFYANENATIPDYDSIPQRKVVRSDYDDVFEDSNWWTSGDEAGANTFLTMPYFPFLSSCAGYGNHMSFAKLVESHPDCTLVSEEAVLFLIFPRVCVIFVRGTNGDLQVKQFRTEPQVLVTRYLEFVCGFVQK